MDQSENRIYREPDSSASAVGVSAIDDAIASAAQDIAEQGVGKSGTNREQNYKYRPLDEVLNVVGPVMARHGLHVSAVYRDRVADRVPTKTGGVKTIVCITGEFTYHYRGESRTTVTIGEAMDSSDKATNKAMSMALKYAHITRFNIPVVGSDDGDAYSPSVPALNDTRNDDHVVGKMGQDELARWLTAVAECSDVDTLKAERDAAYAKTDEYGDADARGVIRRAVNMRYHDLIGSKQ